MAYTEKDKKSLLKAYDATFGNISQACKIAGVDRGTFYDWKRDDKEFGEAIEKMQPKEKYKDWLESKLVKRVNEDSDEFLKYALQREERRLKSKREREAKKADDEGQEEYWESRMEILDEQLEEAEIEQNETDDE